jgi:hypothetical protein
MNSIIPKLQLPQFRVTTVCERNSWESLSFWHVMKVFIILKEPRGWTKVGMVSRKSVLTVAMKFCSLTEIKSIVEVARELARISNHRGEWCPNPPLVPPSANENSKNNANSAPSSDSSAPDIVNQPRPRRSTSYEHVLKGWSSPLPTKKVAGKPQQL